MADFAKIFAPKPYHAYGNPAYVPKSERETQKTEDLPKEDTKD